MDEHNVVIVGPNPAAAASAATVETIEAWDVYESVAAGQQMLLWKHRAVGVERSVQCGQLLDLTLFVFTRRAPCSPSTASPSTAATTQQFGVHEWLKRDAAL